METSTLNTPAHIYWLIQIMPPCLNSRVQLNDPLVSWNDKSRNTRHINDQHQCNTPVGEIFVLGFGMIRDVVTTLSTFLNL